MREDILEQLADDYLQARGFFTKGNLKFKPDAAHPEFVTASDSNHSDIDVLGIHPTLPEPERVMVVSCKSWQDGLDPKATMSAIDRKKKLSGRDAWKGFRELTSPKWGSALCAAVRAATGTDRFVYAIAVTKLWGSPDAAEAFCGRADFRSNLLGNTIRFISLREMADTVSAQLTTTMASSQLARTLQLLRAAGWPAPRPERGPR